MNIDIAKDLGQGVYTKQKVDITTNVIEENIKKEYIKGVRGSSIATSTVGAFAHTLVTSPTFDMDTSKLDYLIEVSTSARIADNNNGVDIGLQYQIDGGAWTNYNTWNHRSYYNYAVNSYPTLYESIVISSGFDTTSNVTWRFTYGSYRSGYIVYVLYGSGGDGTGYIKIKEMSK